MHLQSFTTSDIWIPNKEMCRYLDVFKPNLSLYRLAMTRKMIVIYLRLFWIHVYYKRFIVYGLRSNLMDSMTHQLLHMVWETTANTKCHCGRMTKITETRPAITTFGHMEHHIIIECIFNGIVRDVRASYFSGTTVYEYQSLVYKHWSVEVMSSQNWDKISPHYKFMAEWFMQEMELRTQTYHNHVCRTLVFMAKHININAIILYVKGGGGTLRISKWKSVWVSASTTMRWLSVKVHES